MHVNQAVESDAGVDFQREDAIWLERQKQLDVERQREPAITEQWGKLRQSARALKVGLSGAELENLLGAPIIRRDGEWHFCAESRIDIFTTHFDIDVLLVSLDSQGKAQSWKWYNAATTAKN